MEKGIPVRLPLPPRPSGLLPFCLVLSCPGRQIHFTVNIGKMTLRDRSVPSVPVPLPKPLVDSKVKNRGPWIVCWIAVSDYGIQEMGIH